MAITFVNPNTATATATTASLTRPTGTATGDVLIVMVELFDGGAVIQSLAGTGWTVLDKVQNAAVGNAHSVGTLWRLDNGSASYTVSWDGSSQLYRALILAYHGASAVDVHSMSAQTASTTVFRGPAVTAPNANEMIVMLGGHANTGTATPPSGMTERVDTTSIYAADVIQAASGTTGNKDATLAGADPNTGGLIAISPTVTPRPFFRRRPITETAGFSTGSAVYP